MNFKFLILIALATFLSTSFSQQIYLKKSFFGGPKFSIDNSHYENVEYNANKLKKIIGNNETSLSYIKAYQKNLTASTIFGYVGGFFIGWPIGGYFANQQIWEGYYTTMIGTGTALAVLSIIFESQAYDKLESAISHHNNKPVFTDRLNFQLGYNGLNSSVGINIIYSF